MRRIPERKTTAASVATPMSEVKPTAAEMLKEVCVIRSAKIPPVAQNGRIARTIKASVHF